MLLLPLAAAACLAALGAIYGFSNLPDQAAILYGPPAEGLSAVEQLRLSALLLWQREDLVEPLDPGGEPRSFTVASGEAVPEIADRLGRNGLIANPGALRDFLQYSGLDLTLQAGEYTLSPGMSAVEIARAMQDATPAQVAFRVLAGWRMEEVAGSLPTSGMGIAPEDFMQSVRRPPARLLQLLDLPAGTSLEGYLFPASYELDRSLSANQLLGTLVAEFDRQVSREIRSGFDRQGLDLHQGVILASIVAREAVNPEEAPSISSVFFNRLAIGMKLDADPTVQYALGYNTGQATWWTNPLSAADLAFDSPYNTYLYPSLPPGPIANPGLSSLRAVAFPAQTPYYYFRAACDGSGRHVFSVTFEEHKANACP
jgi:UPF0755 protein